VQAISLMVTSYPRFSREPLPEDYHPDKGHDPRCRIPATKPRNWERLSVHSPSSSRCPRRIDMNRLRRAEALVIAGSSRGPSFHRANHPYSTLLAMKMRPATH